MGRVFISYSHNDSDKVKKVNDFLVSNNILTWLDNQNLRSADNWENHIKTSIYCSSVFLVFLSKNYILSSYCMKEFDLAKAKDNKSHILVIGLDEKCNSFSLENDIKGIQRVNYNFQTESIDDLCKILIKEKYITDCQTNSNFLNLDIKNERNFLAGIELFDVPKHYDLLLSYISFVEYIKECEKNNKYISTKANFSSLVFGETTSSNVRYAIRLIGKNDFTNILNIKVRNDYLKRVLYSLFYYGYVNFDNSLSDNLNINELFTGELEKGDIKIKKELYSIINDELNSIYKNINDLNELSLKLDIVLNASYYVENYFSNLNSHNMKNYEMNELVIKLSRKIVIFNYKIEDKSNETCLAKLLKEDDNKKYFLNELLSNTKENVFLYGDIGCGETTQLIKHFINNPLSIYIDLSLASRNNIDHFIKNSILKTESGYFLNFIDLYNYSIYENKITLLIDDLDRLSDEFRKDVIDELVNLQLAFRIVIFSSKRNVEGKISLDEKDSTFNNYQYCQILPLTKENVINYLIIEGVKSDIINELTDLDENDSFFMFFNDFTKLKVLLESIRNSKEFTIENYKNLSSPEIQIYKNIFEGVKDYSISKRISNEFLNTVVPIGDVIVKLVLNEMEELKEISYSKKYEKIKNMRFKDLNCYYNILGKTNNEYQFLNEDIESYFVASYVINKIQKIKNRYQDIEDLLKPLNDDYSVLKYLSQIDILETIDLDDLFSLENENRYIDLKNILFKISQYTASSRKLYADTATIKEIPDNFFFGAENIKTVMIPKSVEEIGRAAFSNMSRLEKLILVSNTNELIIRPWAILNCQNLKSIKLGKNYLKYQTPLFSKCSDLCKIIIDEDNPVFSTILDNRVLSSKDYKTLYTSVNALSNDVYIPNGVEVLSDNALAYLDNVKKIYLPSTIKKIETNFCDFCDNLEYIFVNTKKYFSDNLGFIFTNDDNGKVLFRVPPGYSDDVIIPSDVVTIGSDSISCCGKTKKIVVPKSIRYVEDYAFADTTSLEVLKFNDRDKIEKFGNYILLTTNNYATVEFTDDEDNEIHCKVDEFNRIYNKKEHNSFSMNINESRVAIDDFINEGFEMISDSKNMNIYKKVVLLRAINLFESFKCEPENYNILLIGMTEYKTINSKPVKQMKEYIEQLLTKKYVSMVVFTRDLPMIRQLYDYTDRVSIIRTSKGSTSSTNKIKEIIKKKDFNYDKSSNEK